MTETMPVCPKCGGFSQCWCDRPKMSARDVGERIEEINRPVPARVSPVVPGGTIGSGLAGLDLETRRQEAASAQEVLKRLEPGRIATDRYVRLYNFASNQATGLAFALGQLATVEATLTAALQRLAEVTDTATKQGIRNAEQAVEIESLRQRLADAEREREAGVRLLARFVSEYGESATPDDDREVADQFYADAISFVASMETASRTTEGANG